MPPVLLRQAIVRLRIVSGACAALVAVGWFIPVLLTGKLADEFRYIAQWGPIALVVGSSLAVYVTSSIGRFRPASVMKIGLLYQVVVSCGIAGAQYLGSLDTIDARYITFDIFGVSPVALWMLFYTVLVPSRPRNALIALLGSAGAVPATYLILLSAGRAPEIGAGQFFFTLVFPYLFCVAASYIAARILYRLGRDLEQARQMGSYQLESVLGSGAMGEVWRARHRMLARPAAIKLIRREAVNSPDDPAGDLTLQRFEREAQATASLRSPHVVELYDFGVTEDGVFYSVMELLDGLDLQRLVEEFGRMPPERVVFLLAQICRALGEAHEEGLIHRDIKPANLYACRFGREYDFVKVVDFGLVKRVKSLNDKPAQMTQVGTIAGTPLYMAPEIIVGGDADARSDLYSLGCVAYWLLTGQTVFVGDNLSDLMLAHIHTKPPRPSKSVIEIPEAIDDIVLWCLNKKPEGRPQNADELLRSLATCDLPETWTQDRARDWWNEHEDRLDDVRAALKNHAAAADQSTKLWP